MNVGHQPNVFAIPGLKKHRRKICGTDLLTPDALFLTPHPAPGTPISHNFPDHAILLYQRTINLTRINAALLICYYPVTTTNHPLYYYISFKNKKSKNL